MPALGVHQWLEDGFTALGLALPNGPNPRSPSYFDRPPPFGYDIERITALSADLSGDRFVYGGMLGLPSHVDIAGVGTISNSDARDGLVQLLDQRRRLLAVTELEIAATKPISATRAAQFETCLRESMKTSSNLVSLLRHVRVPVLLSATGGSASGVVVRGKEPRVLFVDEGRTAIGYEQAQATKLSTIEERRLLRPLFTDTRLVGHFTSAQDIPVAVDGAIHALQSRGFTPAGIFVDFLPDWIDALSDGGNAWELRDPGRYGPQQATRFRGIPVFRFALDGSTIAVVDLLAFYRLLPQEDGWLSVRIEDRYRAESNAILNEARSSPGIPSVDAWDMEVGVSIRMATRAEIADLQAACRIRLHVPATGAITDPQSGAAASGPAEPCGERSRGPTDL